MTHITCRLTAKNRDQLRNPTLGNRYGLPLFTVSARQATAAYSVGLHQKCFVAYGHRWFLRYVRGQIDRQTRRWCYFAAGVRAGESVCPDKGRSPSTVSKARRHRRERLPALSNWCRLQTVSRRERASFLNDRTTSAVG